MALYIPKTAPWAHQQTGLERLAGQPAFALLMAMRTGKTKTLIDNWGGLAASDQLDDLLVIAPGGVYRTWEGAVRDHLGQPVAATTDVYVWQAKAKSKIKRDALKHFLVPVAGRQRVLIINVEALSGVDRAQQIVLEFASQRRCMGVIDESTIIKNVSSKRTRWIVDKLAPHCEYRRILTGLPTPKSPLDLFGQFEFLDRAILGHTNYYSFKARYAIEKMMPIGPGGKLKPIIVGYRHEEQLRARIAPFSYRVRLEDCYDLPPKMYAVRDVPMTVEQQKAYAEMRDFAITQIEQEGFISADQVIVQLMRMHQILCGHSVTNDGNDVTIPSHRIDTLLQLLDEHDSKAIVWCSYDKDVQAISEALEWNITASRSGLELPASPVARFWGGNRSTREEEEQRFINDPACRYMVATASAGGRGRMWAVANLCVYYGNTYDLEHRAQSEERPQAVNKTDSVLYVDLVVPGTVDERRLKVLRKKIDAAAVITGDNWREWVV